MSIMRVSSVAKDSAEGRSHVDAETMDFIMLCVFAGPLLLLLLLLTASVG